MTPSLPASPLFVACCSLQFSLSQSVLQSLPSDFGRFVTVPPAVYLYAVIYNTDVMHHALQTVSFWHIESLTVACGQPGSILHVQITPKGVVFFSFL